MSVISSNLSLNIPSTIAGSSRVYFVLEYPSFTSLTLQTQHSRPSSSTFLFFGCPDMVDFPPRTDLPPLSSASLQFIYACLDLSHPLYPSHLPSSSSLALSHIPPPPTSQALSVQPPMVPFPPPLSHDPPTFRCFVDSSFPQIGFPGNPGWEVAANSPLSQQMRRTPFRSGCLAKHFRGVQLTPLYGV